MSEICQNLPPSDVGSRRATLGIIDIADYRYRSSSKKLLLQSVIETANLMASSHVKSTALTPGPAILAAIVMAGCGRSDSEPLPVNMPARTQEFVEDAPMSLTIQSNAFQQGDPIPPRYTGDGDDVSPPITWEGAPAETREFALICDDPDAPSAEPWVHWVIYKIPADVTSLPEGIPAASRVNAPVSALQGKNSWPSGRTIGYRGPAPPPGHGLHHYRFKVYALDSELQLTPALTKRQFLDVIQGHVIASGELVGTYSR